MLPNYIAEPSIETFWLIISRWAAALAVINTNTLFSHDQLWIYIQMDPVYLSLYFKGILSVWRHELHYISEYKYWYICLHGTSKQIWINMKTSFYTAIILLQKKLSRNFSRYLCLHIICSCIREPSLQTNGFRLLGKQSAFRCKRYPFST